jgi:hypothetical protein
VNNRKGINLAFVACNGACVDIGSDPVIVTNTSGESLPCRIRCAETQMIRRVELIAATRTRR